MNIIYMGTSEFGEPSLRALASAGHTIACVVTQPDRQKNRGMHTEPTAIKKCGLDLKLPVYQPSDINTSESVSYLKKLDTDLFVVIAYGQKLSQEILDIPAIMPLNIHASLLPAFRGAAPINWAVINGENTTGVTLMKVTLRMDTGPVILQKKRDILETDTSMTMAQKLSVDSAQVLLEGISMIESKNYRLIDQDEAKATFAPKLKKTDGLIDWKMPAPAIVNRIKGCVPWPGAFTYFKGNILKIHKAANVSFTGSDTVKAGNIVHISKDGIVVCAGNGSLLIESVQLPGKKVITASEFIAGYKVCVHETLG